MKRDAIEALLEKHGMTDYRWIDPREIVVAEWVRMKCVFGCPSYGHNATCPPNTPTIESCRAFFREYDEALVLRFTKALDRPEDRSPWSVKINATLVDLERDVFLDGNRKAFVLCIDDCCLCRECPGERTECRQPKRARPAIEAMAVDVFATVEKVGYPIEVLSAYDQEMNRYALLLVR